MYTVYKTVNLVNGKYYIGVHKTSEPHDDYLGSGKLLKSAIKKYGVDSFRKEIIAIFEDKDAAYSLESNLVIIGEMSYNLKQGGEGGFDYLNDSSEQHLQRCSLAGKHGAKRTNDKVKFLLETDESYKKQWYDRMVLLAQHAKTFNPNLSFAGCTHSDETKQKMSLAAQNRTGNKNSQYGTMWITNGIENRKIKSTDNIPDGFYRGRVKRRLR